MTCTENISQVTEIVAQISTTNCNANCSVLYTYLSPEVVCYFSIAFFNCHVQGSPLMETKMLNKLLISNNPCYDT